MRITSIIWVIWSVGQLDAEDNRPFLPDTRKSLNRLISKSFEAPSLTNFYLSAPSGSRLPFFFRLILMFHHLSAFFSGRTFIEASSSTGLIISSSISLVVKMEASLNRSEPESIMLIARRNIGVAKWCRITVLYSWALTPRQNEAAVVSLVLFSDEVRYIFWCHEQFRFDYFIPRIFSLSQWLQAFIDFKKR